MKKLALLLLISNFAFAQPGIEIRLVNSNVGYPMYTWTDIGYVSLNTSNDAGLNAILSAYNVNQYLGNDVHPYPPYQFRTNIVTGTYPQQFIDDLLAYSTVVESARITNGFEFSDALILQLVNINIGTPAGTSNNVILTNDSGLNTIFEYFNVFYYVQTYPSSTNNNILRYYTAVCDCDKNLLNTALLNYTAVVSSTEMVNGGIMLSNPQFEKPKAVISPNPFSVNFDIETEQTITNYTIVDITGKILLSTSSKADLDNQSSQLSAGMYLLNLDFDNGQKANYKLVKK